MVLDVVPKMLHLVQIPTFRALLDAFKFSDFSE